MSHHGAGGSGATLPLQGMLPLSFIYQVGRVCGSMSCVRGGRERERERAGENEFKNSSSLGARQGEEEAA
jgi:hypothetical protein